MLPTDIFAQAQQLREAADTMETIGKQQIELARQQAELDMRLAAAQAVLRPSAAPPSLAAQPLITGFPTAPESAATPPPVRLYKPAGSEPLPLKRLRSPKLGGSLPFFIKLVLEALGQQTLTGVQVHELIAGNEGVPRNAHATQTMLRRMRLRGLLEQPRYNTWRAVDRSAATVEAATEPTPVEPTPES